MTDRPQQPLNAGASQSTEQPLMSAESAHRVTGLLRQAGLRPTRQRLELGCLLFTGNHRHLTAESLHDDARASGISVSVATVYNTLHQFTEAGLLREFVVDGTKTYFDTNTSDHHHFYNEKDGAVWDVPAGVEIVGPLEAPPGMRIVRVDLVVRVAPDHSYRRR